MRKMLLWAISLPLVFSAACSKSNQAQPTDENTCREFTSLKDTYNQLSQISGVSEDTIPIIKFGKYDVKVEKNAGANNLDCQQIEKTGNAMFSILDGVPMEYIINGATNHLAAGFVYAKQLSADKNEILIVSCSGEAGYYGAIYGTANDSTVNALQISPLLMQGQKFLLVLEDTPDRQINLFNFYE